MAGNASSPSASVSVPTTRPAGSVAAPQAEAAAPTDAAPANALAPRLKGVTGPGEPVNARPGAGAFDALLAPPTQLPPPAAAPAVAATEAPISETAPAPATPEQLLALLAGAWALPAPPVTGTAPGVPAAAASASTAPGPMVATTPPGASAGSFLSTLVLAAPASTSTGEAAPVPGILTAGAAEPGLADLGATSSGGTDATPSFDAFLSGVSGPAAPSPAREVAPLPAPLPVPADPDAGFDDGFGARIAWMAEQRLGQAQIRLNPEHLGPIEVSLQLDGSRVDAQFHSTHVEVRAALEASVPRLRELLGQHGLQLGQADVGQRQSQGTPSGQPAAPVPDGRNEGGDPLGTTAANVIHRRGLLDEYA